MRVRSFITSYPGVAWGLLSGLGFTAVTTPLIIYYSMLGYCSLVPGTSGITLMIVLGIIWLGVPLIMSILASRQTFKVEQGVVTGTIANALSASIICIALVAFVFLTPDTFFAFVTGPMACSLGMISCCRLGMGWMLLILLPAGGVAISAGPIIGLVGGLIGRAVAK